MDPFNADAVPTEGFKASEASGSSDFAAPNAPLPFVASVCKSDPTVLDAILLGESAPLVTSCDNTFCAVVAIVVIVPLVKAVVSVASWALPSVWSVVTDASVSAATLALTTALFAAMIDEVPVLRVPVVAAPDAAAPEAVELTPIAGNA